jgi:hypothetical protein
MSYFFRRRRRVLFQETLRAQDEARCAVRALKGVVINERLLNWMELTMLRQPFNGQDFFSFRQWCKQKARTRGFAIEKHRASAAHADAATFAGAKKLELRSQYFEQRMVSVNGFLFFDTVYF